LRPPPVALNRWPLREKRSAKTALAAEYFVLKSLRRQISIVGRKIWSRAKSRLNCGITSLDSRIVFA
jgi:hypothetical protein